MCNVLLMWIETHFNDFSEEQIVKLREFAAQLKEEGSVLVNRFTDMLNQKEKQAQGSKGIIPFSFFFFPEC